MTVLERVISTMLIDAEFRNAVLVDPATALADFELSAAERAAVGQMDTQRCESALQILNDQTSQLSAILLATDK